MKTAGIIDRLDFQVLEAACRQLEAWNKSGLNNLWLSCNFTRITMSSEDFLSRFEEIVNKYTFDRKNLIIELTEDSLADNQTVAYSNILACKNAGYQIALDDLGSGYSSFSDLCDYPIDIIKIDRHIISKSVTERGGAFLKGLCKLAHDLNIKVLCEGVETEAEKEISVSAGCDFIQGYYYSRVYPQYEAINFYKKSQEKSLTKTKVILPHNKPICSAWHFFPAAAPTSFGNIRKNEQAKHKKGLLTLVKSPFLA